MVGLGGHPSGVARVPTKTWRCSECRATWEQARRKLCRQGGAPAALPQLRPLGKVLVVDCGWVAGWLVFWVAIGVYALARLLVLGVGRELVEVDSHFLTLRREVGSLGRSRVFDLSQVRSLRYATPPPVFDAPFERDWPPLPLPSLGGSIRFECRGRTHEFGFGTDWKDMEAVLQALRERVPVGHGAGDAPPTP